ncbi:hypothetical protein IU483_17860 [Streptomyces gardneri]|nr:hypothetical protein [Streptomyces gardneri]
MGVDRFAVYRNRKACGQLREVDSAVSRPADSRRGQRGQLREVDSADSCATWTARSARRR